MRRLHVTRRMLVLALLPGAFLCTAAVAGARQRCDRVEVPGPIELPDGSRHDAGTLTLCLEGMWTPTSGRHEIRVNGRSVGAYLSAAGRSEGPAEAAPYVLFARNPEGIYRLVGYAVPGRQHMNTYSMRPVLRKRELAPSLAIANAVSNEDAFVRLVAQR